MKGAKVYASRDSYAHTPDKENYDLVGMPQGVSHTIAAAADGVIVKIVDSNDEDCPAGTPDDEDCNDKNNYVWIKHAHGEWTKYSHMKKDTVIIFGHEEGDTVKAGQSIGIESDVGVASGVHVHFEVGIPDDPANASTALDSGGWLIGVNLPARFCGVPAEMVARGETYTTAECPPVTATLNNNPSDITIGVNPNDRD